jgi:1-deoxyxylulose-5-phosphate synthase
LAREEGLAVIPFNPLAGGLLSGKYKHGDTPEKGRFSAELGGSGQAYHAWYWHEPEFETVARVQEIAKQHGTPITTLSVAWVLANPGITSVILGASRVGQLSDALAAADCKLDVTLKTKLDEASIEFRRGDTGKQGKRWRYKLSVCALLSSIDQTQDQFLGREPGATLSTSKRKGGMSCQQRKYG